LGMGGTSEACESEIDAGGLRAPAKLCEPSELWGSGSRNRLKRDETLFPRKVRLRGVFGGGCSGGACGGAWRGPAAASSAAAIVAVAAPGPLSE
jgi:hypothetical protein